jgi:D-alanyl-D-alanine carboxypeptidase
MHNKPLAGIAAKIESAFRNEVSNSKKVKNAYLLVECKKKGVYLNIAEGETDGVAANPRQPVHLASVGKLFTAALTGILHDEGKLGFDDPISLYLDDELMKGLHVYKGKEYSDKIRIYHLLQQTSGLYDVFYKLWEKMTKGPFEITPREAVVWGKENMKPIAPPGQKLHYTDTNYYLMGLIIEQVTGKQFYEVLHEKIFDPLGMKHACMWRYSKPLEDPEQPMASMWIDGIDARTIPQLSRIDYAGGGITAPLEDYLLFIKAFNEQRLVKQETFETMLHHTVPMGFPTVGFNYGYSIWKFRPVPLLLPKKLLCWGCVGVTGAFMFFHPGTESYIIGSFNDMSYRSKALNFMIRKVVKQLSEIET